MAPDAAVLRAQGRRIRGDVRREQGEVFRGGHVRRNSPRRRPGVKRLLSPAAWVAGLRAERGRGSHEAPTREPGQVPESERETVVPALGPEPERETVVTAPGPEPSREGYAPIILPPPVVEWEWKQQGMINNQDAFLKRASEVLGAHGGSDRPPRPSGAASTSGKQSTVYENDMPTNP